MIEARRVSMRFPGVQALADVDFDVRAGEVHALVGQNGAGKSTLIKILSGELAGYEGELRLDGQPAAFDSPAESIEAGIAVIPQELVLVSTLPAADNIFLGREPRARGGFIDAHEMDRQARAAMSALGEPLPGGAVGTLEAGERQLVAIARALSLSARLLIMDEPSSSLGPTEVNRLEALVRDLAARGVAIVYVSHRLDEVTRLATRVTVLRDGRRVATVPGGEFDRAELIRLMSGRTVERVEVPDVEPDAVELLRVERFSLPDPARPSGYRLKDISLSVRRGEIVGLSGLTGAGRSDFLLALTGALDRRPEGRIVLHDVEYSPDSPVAARRAGLVLLPEDRKAQGIFPDLDVGANVSISRLAAVSTRGGLLDRERERRLTGDVMQQTGVRAASTLVAISTLSGGNQQKALLARCLFASPSVLLLDEPTRGIDVAAKAEIYSSIAGLAARGFAIVLCSSELPEILSLCHRVFVFRDGRIARVLDRAEATEELLLAAATSALPGQTRGPDESGGSAGDPAGAPPGPPEGSRPGRLLSRFGRLLGLAAVVLLAVVFSPVRGGRPVFVDVGNLTDILRQVAEKGILAAGMTPVIISGGIDLSVGFGSRPVGDADGVVAHAGRLQRLDRHPAGPRDRLLLGTHQRPRGRPLAPPGLHCDAGDDERGARGGAVRRVEERPSRSGSAKAAPPSRSARWRPRFVPFVPVPAVVFLVSVGAVAVLMSRMRAGRYIYAIGDNEQAARLSGVNVRLHKAMVYVLCAGLAALAGIIHCAQLEQGNPNDGVGYELDAIAAVVIGGTSLSGGVGTVGGTLVGTLIIGIINNSMGLNNVDANLQLILKGAIILAAVWLQTRRR